MLIDVNLSFGGRETIQQFRVETMLEQRYRYPYSLGFVHCNQGMTDAALANEQTLALCREHPDLLPVGVIHPRDTFTWKDEVERCLAAGVRIFRLWPDQGNWPVDSIFLKQIVERLAATGVVLMVEATTPGLPSKVAELTAGSGLRVIFTEVRYYPMTEVLPLMEKYPHIYVETSRITSPENIELCVSRVGASRLLFGSGAARYPGWVAWQVIERAEIAHADREAIYFRNAARLLNVSPSPGERAVLQPAGWQARAVPIVDVHMHDKFPAATVKPYTPAQFEADMRHWGITEGVCSSVTGIFYDIRQGNDEMAAMLEQIPFLHGYVVVDPRYYAESVQELRRLESNPRFVGVKIHAAYAKTLTVAPEMRRLFQAIAGYQKPVLIHNLGSDWPEALVAIAAEHSELPIIAAHAGYGDGPHATHDAALRVASAPNIYLEFCSTYLATGAIRRGIEAVGMDRVMYGSDFPLIAQPYMLSAYEEAELSEEEVQAILYRNARRLFRFG